MDDLAFAIADARYMGERNNEGLDPMEPSYIQARRS